MCNNDVLKKLRVALHLIDDDIVGILGLVGFTISKSELGAFFRSPDHPKYKECGDQILRNFLNGLVIYMRGPKDAAGKTAADAGESSKTKIPTMQRREGNDDNRKLNENRKNRTSGREQSGGKSATAGAAVSGGGVRPAGKGRKPGKTTED